MYNNINPKYKTFLLFLIGYLKFGNGKYWHLILTKQHFTKRNNNISSGDDVFLLEKMISKFSNQVHFLKSKNAIVITKPQSTLKNLYLSEYARLQKENCIKIGLENMSEFQSF